jgi:IS1 family transposase/transposase-like protein
MTNQNTLTQRPPLETLACVNSDCKLYGQPDQGNLIIRKHYGVDQLRYLRCTCCKKEFSERKGTGLWNTKVPEQKAIQVAEQLAEGTSQEATARLVKVDLSVVRRLYGCLGQHGRLLHQQKVQGLCPIALQADERHGYAVNKQQGQWEAEVIDPQTKLVVAHVQGRRNHALIERLLRQTAACLANRHNLLLMTDGEVSYATLFPEIFGVPYQPARQGECGRKPKVRYRIPRQLAHVQVVKHREGQRVVKVEIRHVHGSQKYAQECLVKLGCQQFNTSFIERRNGTARRMSAYQVRRSSAFARRPEPKTDLGWWGVTIYNWSRPHRSLRRPLAEAAGRRLYDRCTPAMAAGLTDRVWSVRDVLLTQILPAKPRGDHLT